MARFSLFCYYGKGGINSQKIRLTISGRLQKSGETYNIENIRCTLPMLSCIENFFEHDVLTEVEEKDILLKRIRFYHM